MMGRLTEFSEIRASFERDKKLPFASQLEHWLGVDTISEKTLEQENLFWHKVPHFGGSITVPRKDLKKIFVGSWADESILICDIK